MLACCCTKRAKAVGMFTNILNVAGDFHQKQIIAVVGQPSSGRTSICKHLVKEHRFELLSLKQPVYDAITCLGVQNNDLLDVEADSMEIPCERLGEQITAKEMADFAEYGFKEMFGDDFLLHNAQRRIQRLKNAKIVIDDLDSDKEALFFKSKFGAHILKVTRPTFDIHGYPKIECFDCNIINDQTLAVLKATVDNVYFS